MTEIEGTEMYWGCVSGSMSKALRHMEETHVMVSYASTAKLWDWIDKPFLDSGGYSLMLEQGSHPPTPEYMGYVAEHEPHRYALQDYPCEPEIMAEYDRTVQQHQEMTVERAAEGLAYHEDHGIDSEPIAVIQGWDIDDYVHHVDRMAEQGCLTDTVGIGSICRRGEAGRIRRIIQAVHDALPIGTEIHCFGVKNNILTDRKTREIVDSVDSAAWYYQMYDDKPVPEPAWQTCVSMYLEYRRKLYDRFGVGAQAVEGQTTLDSLAIPDGGNK